MNWQLVHECTMRAASTFLLSCVCCMSVCSLAFSGNDISLWIDQKEVNEFAGFPMEIFVIADGVVLPYILDINFEQFLPVIPSAVEKVKFTWKAGSHHKYFYDFDQLKSYNESILSDPYLSIEPKGKVPKKAKVFQVHLPCLGNQSGVASFGIGLVIQHEKGFLTGTPLRLRLQKHCADHAPDPECDVKCERGHCNQEKVCECPKGYMGKYCQSALCYPKCMNGGTCILPGVCACADGFQGPHCEGGMCREKCLNGGKCIQKDTCLCRRGYYGVRCEYSKCTAVPCLNDGKCIGVNRCRCRKGFVGKQCEGKVEKSIPPKNDGCKKKCSHGACYQTSCICNKGWYGKRCNRRKPRQRRQRRMQL